MRTSVVFIIALVLIGCESSRRGPPLTAAQAAALAMLLANDKAEALFQHRPFQESQRAQFADGRWTWIDRQGAGLLTYEAKVELSTDGATNSVDVKLLDDALHPKSLRPGPMPIQPWR